MELLYARSWPRRFNSRTPGGVRLCCSTPKDHPLVVSIHAPREGCDYSRVCLRFSQGCFNSRTPGGVRPIAVIVPMMATGFQFTHPGRGATASPPIAPSNGLFQFTHPGRGATHRPKEVGAEVGVSIHAPREGCDRSTASPSRRQRSFNSRTPGGVRQHCAGLL